LLKLYRRLKANKQLEIKIFLMLEPVTLNAKRRLVAPIY
jgi:hypothetical protein